MKNATTVLLVCILFLCTLLHQLVWLSQRTTVGKRNVRATRPTNSYSSTARMNNQLLPRQFSPIFWHLFSFTLPVQHCVSENQPNVPPRRKRSSSGQHMTWRHILQRRRPLSLWLRPRRLPTNTVEKGNRRRKKAATILANVAAILANDVMHYCGAPLLCL